MQYYKKLTFYGLNHRKIRSNCQNCRKLRKPNQNNRLNHKLLISLIECEDMKVNLVKMFIDLKNFPEHRKSCCVKDFKTYLDLKKTKISF